MAIVDGYWWVWLIGFVCCAILAFKSFIGAFAGKSPIYVFLGGLGVWIFGALFGVSMLIKIISYATHGG